MKTLHIYVLSVFLALNAACKSGEVSSASLPEPSANSPTATQTPKTELDAESLCARLSEMKDMPYDPSQTNDDPIYQGLMNAGDRAVPCLIEKITDATPMVDPNKSPSVSGFTVGDAATFMLLYITDQNWQPESMFPRAVAKE